MAHTTMPAAHSEADAVLASQVGRRLQLRELHVFWTHPVGELDQEPDEDRPAPSFGLFGAIVALGTLIERVGGRLAGVRR